MARKALKAGSRLSACRAGDRREEGRGGRAQGGHSVSGAAGVGASRQNDTPRPLPSPSAASARPDGTAQRSAARHGAALACLCQRLGRGALLRRRPLPVLAPVLLRQHLAPVDGGGLQAEAGRQPRQQRQHRGGRERRGEAARHACPGRRSRPATRARLQRGAAVGGAVGKEGGVGGQHVIVLLTGERRGEGRRGECREGHTGESPRACRRRRSGVAAAAQGRARHSTVGSAAQSSQSSSPLSCSPAPQKRWQSRCGAPAAPRPRARPTSA